MKDKTLRDKTLLAITFPAEGAVITFFSGGESLCHHSILVLLV
jgi:hypothetical protein